MKMLQEKINFEEAKNKALDFVRAMGPAMPTQVAKEIKIPPLFASALLSQLISEKSMKVSHLKIGGTPLYYIEGQKEKLLNFTNHLPNIEKEICERLQKEGIIADESVRLAEKVALRNIKDFSVPLSVKVGERKKIFWRWFELSQEDSLSKIEKLLRVYERKPIKEGVKEVREEIKEGGAKEEEAREITKEEGDKPKPAKIDFSEKIKEFLANNKVKILEENIIRRNGEIEFMLQLNSSLGKMTFFAIAKNKKVLTPADLTLAYYRSQEKKLPLILLNSGRFTKKAEERAGELGITLKSLEEKI